MEYVLNGLIILGALILIIALIGTNNLIGQLPKGKVRRNWYVLRVLIVIFILGYISYTVVTWNDNLGHAGSISYYVVPLIYFLGACFVFLVINFALDTAVYVRHFAVMELENITDPMLGIHNRRYFDHRIDYEVKRAVRYKTPLSLLFLDVDHFKQLNETYGNQVGDFVLTSLGKLLLNAARATDIVARYGGEQIMIIATNTPISAIPVYAERLRRTIEEAILMPPGEFTKGQVVRVTASIGVSGLGSEISTAQAMVKSAEEALRDAKARGRNIVIVNKPGPAD
ncbi:MAG: GGDEF domain-containing protein [Chitinispirillaceae bacterium]|jgi:diguanylate cyclase (GGDEF)-like protein